MLVRNCFVGNYIDGIESLFYINRKNNSEYIDVCLDKAVPMRWIDSRTKRDVSLVYSELLPCIFITKRFLVSIYNTDRRQMVDLSNTYIANIVTSKFSKIATTDFLTNISDYGTRENFMRCEQSDSYELIYRENKNELPYSLEENRKITLAYTQEYSPDFYIRYSVESFNHFTDVLGIDAKEMPKNEIIRLFRHYVMSKAMDNMYRYKENSYFKRMLDINNAIFEQMSTDEIHKDSALSLIRKV